MLVNPANEDARVVPIRHMGVEWLGESIGEDEKITPSLVVVPHD